MKTEKELQRLKERREDRWNLFFATATQGLLCYYRNGIAPSYIIEEAKNLTIEMVKISDNMRHK
ncbi:MAG TPA: hypothetical protein ENI76_10800 [Ignavibacteria bacterium]|nr:hypothetical protein [Ignavibacteria bacterium]